MAEASATSGADQAVRVVLPEAHGEAAGAILMDILGPFECQQCCEIGERAGRTVALVFYPGCRGSAADSPALSPDEILAALPPALRPRGGVRVETYEVSRDWVNGWKDHFRPVVVGQVCIHPPWVSPGCDGAASELDGTSRAAPIDVVINPGLGFGTGLHPTTQGTLRLLQQGTCDAFGPLVDAGTGSGVLAVVAAKLGWGPIVAFDNDSTALQSARDNVRRNGVNGTVRVSAADVVDAPLEWFAGATVLANMTLEPVTVLVHRLAEQSPAVAGGAATPARPRRLVVSGILAGRQERALLSAARGCGFTGGSRLRQAGWVSLELLPRSSAET